MKKRKYAKFQVFLPLMQKVKENDKNFNKKILWHVVRFECLVGIEILKYEFWPFLQQTEKNLVTAITFAYDVEKTRFIYQKN